ncbi:MAG: tetratricopeptide repeat protein [Acidobacteriota bacterium]
MAASPSRSSAGIARRLALAAIFALARVARADTLADADAAYKAGRYAEAVGLAQSALKAQETAAGYIILGKALMRTDKLDASLKAFQSALELEPKAQGAHFFRGTIFAKQGRKADAEKELALEVAVTPNSAQTHCQLGILRHDLGKPSPAAQSLARCVELDPRNQAALKLLLATYVELKRPNDATLLLEKLPKDDADLPSFAYNVALIFYGKNQDAKAASALRTALAAKPDMASAHYLLGLTLARQDKDDEAKTELKAYLDAEPSGEHAADARKALDTLK